MWNQRVETHAYVRPFKAFLPYYPFYPIRYRVYLVTLGITKDRKGLLVW